MKLRKEEEREREEKKKRGEEKYKPPIFLGNGWSNLGMSESELHSARGGVSHRFIAKLGL